MYPALPGLIAPVCFEIVRTWLVVGAAILVVAVGILMYMYAHCFTCVPIQNPPLIQ